jgi:hypothetical protein
VSIPVDEDTGRSVQPAGQDNKAAGSLKGAARDDRQPTGHYQVNLTLHISTVELIMGWTRVYTAADAVVDVFRQALASHARGNCAQLH